MSYNGSGTFNINTAGQPVVTGTVTSSTAFNALTSDLGTGLSTAITKDGQTVATARIPFAQGINSSLVTDATSTTTGSIITAGGVGIAKALFVGTTVNIAGTTTLAGVTATSITDSGLTAGRVTYATTAGLLTDAANLTFNGTTLTANTIGAFTLGGTVAGGGNQLNNVIIGTTNPLAGAFTTLSATGTLSGGTSGTGYSFSGSAPATSLTLNSSGNLLVGTTNGTGKLIVEQSANAINTFMYASNASYTDGVLDIEAARNTTNSSYSFIQCAVYGVAYRFYVRDSGNVQNTNNSYGAISDVKLKDNIIDASPKLADLMKVKVRQYNFKSDQTHKQIGVIAQELEQIFPAMIEESPDKDMEGNDLGTTTKSVKYSVFVPMLIKAIQEQQAIITALTTRITALEAK